MGETAGMPREDAAGGQTDRDIETHLTIVAVLALVFSLPLVALGLVVFLGSLVGAGVAEAFGDVPGIGALIGAAGLIVGALIAALGVPGTIAGIGLLKRRSWAKVWTIVVAALNLVNVPLGTAFGVYAIWVVTRPETEAALG